MSVLRNIFFFQSLRGTPARRFDVSRLLHIELHKRAFMLIDRNLPFEVHIRYVLQQPSTAAFGISQFDTWFAMRYSSERDAVDDMNEIKDKQRRIAKIVERLAKESEQSEREQGL